MGSCIITVYVTSFCSLILIIMSHDLTFSSSEHILPIWSTGVTSSNVSNVWFNQQSAVIPLLWDCGWRPKQTAGFQADWWWRWGCRGQWKVPSGHWQCIASPPQLLQCCCWRKKTSSGASVLTWNWENRKLKAPVHLFAWVVDKYFDKIQQTKLQHCRKDKANELQVWCRAYCWVFWGSLNLQQLLWLSFDHTQSGSQPDLHRKSRVVKGNPPVNSLKSLKNLFSNPASFSAWQMFCQS